MLVCTVSLHRNLSLWRVIPNASRIPKADSMNEEKNIEVINFITFYKFLITVNMGIKEIKVCDKCDKENVVGTKNIMILLGRVMDAAGDVDDDYITFDLCPNCMAWLIENTYKYKSDWNTDKLKAWLTNYR